MLEQNERTLVERETETDVLTQGDTSDTGCLCSLFLHKKGSRPKAYYYVAEQV